MKSNIIIGTGLELVDKALADYAHPFIIHSHGISQSGKTTLAIQSVISASTNGYRVLWIDTDLKFDIRRVRQISKAMGVQNIGLDYLIATEAEQVLDMIKRIENQYDFVVIDSIASPFRTPVPDEEFRLKSMLYEKILPKIGTLALMNDIGFWLINQGFVVNGRLVPVEGKIISNFASVELEHQIVNNEIQIAIKIKGKNTTSENTTRKSSKETIADKNRIFCNVRMAHGILRDTGNAYQIEVI